MPAQQFQRFCYTYYPPEGQTKEELELHYRALRAVSHYHLYAHENCPTTGRFHHQGFFWLRNGFKKTESGVRKLMPKVHVEACRGSAEENYIYCRKLMEEHPNEEWFEYGKMPESGAQDRTRLENVLDVARTQGVMAAAQHDPSIWARNINAVAVWANMHQVPRDFKTICIYIWGVADAGKSRWAVSHGAYPVQVKHGFFRGYRNQKIILIDDLDVSSMGMTRSEWLTLFDRYPLTLNVKGGAAEFNSKIIMVTSNFPPDITFGTMWDAAMQRRFEKIFRFPLEKDEAEVYITSLEGSEAPAVQQEEAVCMEEEESRTNSSSAGPSRLSEEPSC